MKLLILLGVAGLAYGIVYSLARMLHRQLVAACRLAADELGLEVEAGSVWGRPRLHGRIDGIEVEVLGSGGGNNRGTRMHARAPGAACKELQLAERRAQGGRLVRDECSTGDGLFDGAWRVEGAPGLALAILDEETRSALLEAGVDVEILVRYGDVTVTWSGGFGRWDLVVEGVQAALDVARRVGPVDADAVPGLLAQRACDDSDAAVRAAALGLLVREHRGHDACAGALVALADDASPEVRRLVLQAQGTPAEGRLALAESAEGELSLAGAEAGALTVKS